MPAAAAARASRTASVTDMRARPPAPSTFSRSSTALETMTGSTRRPVMSSAASAFRQTGCSIRRPRLSVLTVPPAGLPGIRGPTVTPRWYGGNLSEPPSVPSIVMSDPFQVLRGPAILSRGPARVAALAAALSIVITGCGLAVGSTRVLAPEIANEERAEPAAVTTTASEPAPAAPAARLAAPEAILQAKAALPSATVGAMKHVWQSLNNCGPAAVVMALSTLGIDESQEVARLALRGPDERRGMGPGPVGPWVAKEFGLASAWRNNGTHALLKTLVTNGFAPMVTQWMVDPSVSRVSHWRTVRGYDDARGVFYVNDPMLGNNVPLAYGTFQSYWQAFSYRYMVVYKPSDEPLLRAIVGAEWDDRTMRRSYYERAKAEALAQGTSAAYLAYGEASYQYGLFAEAVEAIEKGMALGSATGVFMIRSSLPNALRALGRFEEATAAQAKLANITPGVTPAASSVGTTTSTSFRLDPSIAAILAAREREARAYAASELRLRAKLERDR